jgi:hypothetical protein
VLNGRLQRTYLGHCPCTAPLSATVIEFLGNRQSCHTLGRFRACFEPVKAGRVLGMNLPKSLRPAPKRLPSRRYVPFRLSFPACQT